MPFKRILNTVGQFLRKVPAAPKPPPSQQPDPSSTSNLFAENNLKASQASRDLMDAIKTLSQNDTIAQTTSRPPSSSSISSRLKSIDIDLEKATVEELEQSARLFFEGTEVIPADQTRAVSLWARAAEKGSLESRYSFALCLKDGLGVFRDPVAALSHLQYLADEHNFNLAHVKIISSG